MGLVRPSVLNLAQNLLGAVAAATFMAKVFADDLDAALALREGGRPDDIGFRHPLRTRQRIVTYWTSERV